MSRKQLTIDLQGEDGNIFSVLSKAGKLVKHDKQIEMANKVFSSGSYQQALDVINEYVEIEDISGMYKPTKK